LDAADSSQVPAILEDESVPLAAAEVVVPHIEVKESASVSVAIIGAVEAVVLSAERAITPARIAAAVFHSSSKKPIDDDQEPKVSASDQRAIVHAIETLNADYERTGRSFRIESISGGYRVMTLPKFAEAVASFKRARQSTKLSKPAIETLAIVAYRQPITRAELEAIRGVACGEVLKSLVERKLVTITGRAEEVGRPMLYGTTKQFLDHFGLASIKDLPAPAEFARLTS
jgi:segregation and condensation protein B